MYDLSLYTKVKKNEYGRNRLRASYQGRHGSQGSQIPDSHSRTSSRPANTQATFAPVSRIHQQQTGTASRARKP